MGLIAAITEFSPDSDGDIVELSKAIARLEEDRAKAEAENSRLPDAIDRAILADEDAQADKLEKKVTANLRVLRKVGLSLPILQRRLFDAEEVRRERLIIQHRAAALDRYDAVSAALEALLNANARAGAAFDLAARDLGHQVAAAYVQAPIWSRVNIEMATHWREQTELALGRRQVCPALPAGTINVKMKIGTYRYNPGEEVSVPEAEAHQLVRDGIAAYSTPESVLVPVPPSEAPAPEPDANGYVEIVIVKACGHLHLWPRDEPGAFQPGEVGRFPISQATRMVRGGYAEFLPVEASDDVEAEAAT